MTPHDPVSGRGGRPAVVPSLADIFWGKLANGRRRVAEWRKRGLLTQEKRDETRRRIARLEPLEPRLLLSADLMPTAGDDAGDESSSLEEELNIAASGGEEGDEFVLEPEAATFSIMSLDADTVTEAAQARIVSALQGVIDEVGGGIAAQLQALGGDIAGLGLSPQEIFTLQQSLEDHLLDTVEALFDDALPLPTYGDLSSALDALAEFDSADVQFDAGKVSFDLVYRPSYDRTVEVDFAAGASAGIDASASLALAAEAVFDFAIGIDLDTSLSLQDAVFVEVNALHLDLEAHAPDIDVTASFGALAAEIVDGSFDLEGRLEVAVRDPNADGRLTLAELDATPLGALLDLTPTGTLAAALPLNFTAGGFDTAAYGTPTVKLASSNIFEAAPDVSVDVAINADLRDAILDALDEIDNRIDSVLGGADSILGTELPGIGKTLGELFGLGSLPEALALKPIVQGYFDGAATPTVSGLLNALNGALAGTTAQDIDLDQLDAAGRNFAGALASGLDLRGFDFHGADLRGAILTGANLAGVDLRGADLSGANLTGANLRGALLDGANLAGANLTNAFAVGVDFARARFDASTTVANLLHDVGDVLPSAWTAAARLFHASAPDKDFSGFDFAGFDLSGLDLAGLDFTGANLSGANLRGAILNAANLSGADLSGALAVAADFTGAVLDAATVVDDLLHDASTLLDEVDAAAAKLLEAGAELAGLNLKGFDFSNLNLAGIDFGGTDLRNANLSGAQGLDLSGVTGLVGAKLRDAAFAAGTDFLASLDIRYADLAGLDLGGFDLTGADLRGAVLEGVNLAGANLDGVLLQGARLLGADLTGAINTATAVYDALTSGVDLSVKGAINAAIPGGLGVSTGGPAFKLSGGLDADSLTLEFRLLADVHHLVELDFSFDLGSVPQLAALQTVLTVGADGKLTAGLDIDLDLFFGIDLGGLESFSAPGLGDIYFGVDEAAVSAGVAVTDLDVAVAFGDGAFTGSVENGLITLDASIAVEVTDPTPADGRITLDELPGATADADVAGSFKAELPLNVTAGAFNLNDIGTPVVLLRSLELFDDNGDIHVPEAVVDFRLAAALEQHILDLLGGLADAAGAITGALDVDLPLLGNVGERLGMADLVAQIQALETDAETYFDQFDTLPGYSTLSGLLHAVFALDIWALDLESADAVLTFPVAFNFEIDPPAGTLSLDFDLEGGLSDFELDATADIEASVRLAFVLGIDLGALSGGDAVADSVFVQQAEDGAGNLLPFLHAHARAEATSFDAAARFGFIGVNVEDGSAEAEVDLKLELRDPSNTDGADRITLNELVSGFSFDPAQVSGFANASLPLSIDAFGIDAGTTITLDIPDITDPENIVVSPPLGSLPEVFGQFQNMSAASFASLLGRVSDILDGIRDSRFNDLEIPFTDVSVGDLLDLKDAFAHFLLFDDGGSSADANQRLLGDLNAALIAAGLGGTIRAETRGNRITLVAEDLSVDSFQVQAGAGAGVLGLAGTQSSAAADGLVEVSFNAVDAANDAVYKLTGGDVSFQVKVGDGEWVTVLVKQSDAANNTELGTAESKLLFENNAATFVTAQDMVLRLNDVLGVGLVYDAATQSLYFDFSLSDTLFQGELPLKFDLDLAPLADLSTNASLRLQADADLSLRIGVALGDAPSGTLLTTGTDLDDLNSGEGVDIKDKPSVLGDAGVRASTWHLSADAHFNLFINGSSTATPITITKAATLNNTSEAGLATDLNNALSGTGITAVIQDSRVKLVAGSGVTSFRLEAATSDPAVRELGLGASQAAQNQSLTAAASGGHKLAADPENDDKAAEFTLTIDGTETTVALLERDTADNASRADLVEDVNDALVRAGLGGKIYAELSGSAIKLLAADAAVASFTLATEAGDPAAAELGFTAAAASAEGGAKTLVASKDLRTSVGRFGADLSFNVTLGGETTTVTLKAQDGAGGVYAGVDLSGNNSMVDLAADINRALRNAGLQLPLADGQIDLESDLRVEALGNRLLFTGGGSTPFTITPTAATAAALGLKAGGEASDNHDLVITTHDGAVSLVSLDGADDLGDVIEKIVQATGGSDATLDRSDPAQIAGLTFGKVRVEFDESRTGLKFIDTTSGSGEFMITSLNGSKAALDLRIVGREGLEDLNDDGVVDAFDGKGIIDGGQIGGVTLLDRLFLENAVISADLLITSEPASGDDPAVAEGLSASATFGDFVTLSLDGGATLTAAVEAGLKNPLTGELGGKVTLTQLIQGLSEPASIIQTPTFSAGGSFDLGVSVDPNIPGLIGLGSLPRLTINIDDFGNPFAASAVSQALSGFGLGAGSSFQVELNVPGLGERTITVTPEGLATTAEELQEELNEALKEALGALGSEYEDLISAAIQTSGGQSKLVLTAREGSGVETFTIANAVGTAASILGFDSNDFGELTNQVADLLPDIDFDFHNLGDLLKFDNIDFNFSAILDALIALSDFLDRFEAFDFLDQDLPLLNMSVNDVLDFADRLDAAITEAQANPAGAIQELDAKLKQALGTTGSASLLTLDTSGADGIAGNDDDDDVLRIALDLTSAFSRSVGISIPNIDIPVLGEVFDLGGSADLGVNGSIEARLHLGVSLDDPTDVFIYNTTGLFGSLNASGSDLDFRAALGPLGIFIKDGTASAAGSIAAGVDLDGDDIVDNGTGEVRRMLIGELLDGLGELVAFDLNGSIDVVLPTFFPTNTSAQGAFELHIAAGTDWETVDLADAITLPTFSADALSSLGLFDSILLAVDGMDLFLGGLQDIMDGEIFSFELPFIGDKLSAGADFIEDFREGFFADFRDFIQTAADMAANFTDAELNVISGLLFDLLGPDGIDLLKPLDAAGDATHVKNPGAGAAGGSVSDYIRLTTDDSGFVQWDFTLGGVADIGTEVDFDFGIPGLGLEAEGNIGVQFEWDLDLGFGLSLDEGFYLNVADDNELAVNVAVTLPHTLTGRLAILQLTAVEKNVVGTDADGNTRLGLAFMVDINNKTDSSDGRLSLAEFGRLGFDVGVAADAVAELGLTLGLNNDLLGLDAGTAAGIPEIVADFVFDWGIGDYDYADFESSAFVDIRSVGNAIKEGLQLVEFRDVSLDVGSFLSDVLGPIVGEVKKITEPLQPLIDIITTPLPVISDLGPDLTLLDLAAAYGNVDPRMIYAIADVISLVNRIPDPDEAGTLLINFGTFTLIDSSQSLLTDLTNPNLNFAAGGLLDGLLTSQGKKSMNFDGLLGGASGSSSSKSTMQDLRAGNAGSGFSFPIFDDPSQVFGLLMGQPATLVAYDMAPLVFEFEWSQFFSIWGPLGVSVNVEFGADIDFDFGYDTLGMQQFVEGGFQNPLALLNGFFVGDLINGVDVPEVELFGSLWAAAELNLGVARAGVGGGITAEIDFNLNDPDADGKVRILEIIGNIENQLNAPSDAEKLLAPLAMFDVSGRVFAELFAFLKIDLLFWSVDKKFNITPPITLIDFDLDFFRPPKLATELDNGDLILNMGEFAGDRLQGPREDVAEHFELQFVDADTVKVRATNLGSDAAEWQEYGVTGKIIAVTGEGDDRITVVSGASSSVAFDIDGGAGNDTFDLANVAGNARVRGGEGNDSITTGSGSDVIHGDRGNDTLSAGGGFDIVFGDSGSITGSNVLVDVSLADGNDILDGGEGSDIVFGGGGDDTVSGGGDADIVIGDGGLVVMGSDVAQIGDWLVDHTERGTLGGHDTLYGHAGADRLFGGKGNDKLDGGSGADLIYGQAGDDIAYGGGGADTLYGAQGNDVIYGLRGSFGGFTGDSGDAEADGNDTIYGGDGNDEIHGNGGDDTIYGEAGHDDIYGDAGRDSLFGQDGNDRIWGGDEVDATPEDGALGDLIFGGAGDDTVDGGAGADLIYAGVGSDLIEGGQDGDTITIDFLGAKTHSLTVITDAGTRGSDKVVVNTTDADDKVLLRAHFSTGGTAFIALLNQANAIERVNYDRAMESFVLNTLYGNDFVAIDDTRAVGTVNLGLGDDRLQVGQVFRSPRDGAAGVGTGDYVATIETTRGFLTNGVSFDLTVNGGAGNDEFTVYHNLASLVLNGNDGDDSFLIKAFALAGSQDNERGRMDLTGGGGADTIQYVVNAPVFINGGDGFDTIVIIGTEFGDDFVITDKGVFGAGLNVNFVNIEALRVDGAEGDDRFFVQSTNPQILTEIFGGLGSDTFSIAGDTPAVASNDLKGHSGLVVHDVESGDAAYDGLKVDGISANVADNDAPAIIVTPLETLLAVAEGGLATASYTIVLSRKPTHEVIITAQMPQLPPDELARAFETIEFVGGNRVIDAQGKYSSAQLRFNADNWFVAQTVTVQAVDDLASEGPQQIAITHKVESADTISGGDADLTGVTQTAVTVASALFPTDGPGLQGAVLTLTSPTGYYQTRVIASNTATTLSLIGDKWQDLPDDLAGYTFEIKRFDGLAIPIVQLDVLDNDRAGVTVTDSGGSTDLREPEVTVAASGQSDTFTVSLTRAPTAPVTVTLAAAEQVTMAYGGTSGATTLELVFAPGDWAAKTITLAPIADGEVEGFHFGYVNATVSSGDVDVVLSDSDSFAAPDPTKAEGPRTSVDLSHVPIASSVVVTVNGAGLPAGISTQVSANTVLFVNAAGTPVALDGAISVSYQYREAGYDSTPFRRVTAAITDADAPGVLITESKGSTSVICHKTACAPGAQPRPGSIPARSTARRPQARRNRAHFRGTDAKEFPILRPHALRKQSR